MCHRRPYAPHLYRAIPELSSADCAADFGYQLDLLLQGVRAAAAASLRTTGSCTDPANTPSHTGRAVKLAYGDV